MTESSGSRKNEREECRQLLQALSHGKAKGALAGDIVITMRLETNFIISAVCSSFVLVFNRLGTSSWLFLKR